MISVPNHTSQGGLGVTIVLPLCHYRFSKIATSSSRTQAARQFGKSGVQLHCADCVEYRRAEELLTVSANNSDSDARYQQHRHVIKAVGVDIIPRVYYTSLACSDHPPDSLIEVQECHQD